MARTMWGAFNEFEGVILPTSNQINSLNPKINTAGGFLAKAFPITSDMPLLRTSMIGSAAHGTLVRQVNDIDMMAVFDDSSNIWENSYQYNSQAFMQRIKRAFGNSRVQTIGVRGQAVRLFYQDNIHVDIAPVFSWTPGGYILPSGTGSWIRTDPDTQATWFSNRDIALGNHLIPFIRLAKRWNDVHGRPLKSFHLSVIAGSMFKSIGTDRPAALKMFFELLPSYIDVEDPAGHSGKLSGYLSPLQRVSLTSRASSAAARANNAIIAAQRGNHSEANKLWRIELGNEFPI